MILQVDIDKDDLKQTVKTAENISTVVVMEGDAAAVEVLVGTFFETDPSSTDAFLATISWCAIVMTCVIVVHIVILQIWYKLLPDTMVRGRSCTTAFILTCDFSACDKHRLPFV